MEMYERLEYEWACFLVDRGWTGSRNNVVGCSSGTAALHLALEALRLPGGSDVLVPDYTMVACARAVTLAGLAPKFIDCRRSDLLINPEQVGRAADYRTSAIMTVDVYGRRCNMDAIHDTAGRHKLTVIEDLAEAHGTTPHPATAAACCSFYKNKIVAGEEGGAVAFRDESHADYARKLRSLGFNEPHDYSHIPRGHNYRLSNTHARLILESLTNYDANVSARRELVAAYDAACPPEWRLPPRNAPWVYDLRIPGMTADQQDELVTAVRSAGVQARHGFKPMSLQKEYWKWWAWPDGPEREADRASREVIYLPCEPRRSVARVRTTMDLVRTIVATW